VTLEYLCAPSPRLAAKELMMTHGEAGIPSWPAVDLDLRVETVNTSERALKKDFTGGYLIGAMEVLYPDLENPGQDLVIPVRFEIQYPFNKNPEYHIVHFSASPGALARTFRFGHSYGWIGPDSLWDFNDWTTYRDSTMRIDGTAQVVIDWRGLFPYPKGEDITRKAADPGL
jgi:hypothetical protein